MTNYVDSHPGGPSIIVKYAGKDATEAFEPLHSSDTIEKYLQPEYARSYFQWVDLLTSVVGRQNMGSVSGSPPLVKEDAPLPAESTSKEAFVVPKKKKASLHTIINIADFEVAASQLMKPKSFACTFEYSAPFHDYVSDS